MTENDISNEIDAAAYVPCAVDHGMGSVRSVTETKMDSTLPVQWTFSTEGNPWKTWQEFREEWEDYGVSASVGE